MHHTWPTKPVGSGVPLGSVEGHGALYLPVPPGVPSSAQGMSPVRPARGRPSRASPLPFPLVFILAVTRDLGDPSPPVAASSLLSPHKTCTSALRGPWAQSEGGTRQPKPIRPPGHKEDPVEVLGPHNPLPGDKCPEGSANQAAGSRGHRCNSVQGNSTFGVM